MRLIIVACLSLLLCFKFALAGNGLVMGGIDISETAENTGLVQRKRDVTGAINYDGADDIKVDVRRQIVSFKRGASPGTIIVNTRERLLYFVLKNKQAIRYPVGVGREGFAWTGRDVVSRKAEWPDWRPPAEMIEREAEKGHIIPVFMEGGENNPLGARALYIGSTAFRIHGTTQPKTIGHAVSSGCIRMLNDHVIDLYDRVSVGARVIVE